MRHLEPVESPVHIPWPVLAFACLLAETKVILVHFRRETHSFSLSEVPAVIGLFFVTPNEYMLAVLAGSGIALLVTARQSIVKVAFNLANFALIAVVTLGVFHRIAPLSGPPGAVDWVAAFSAMLVAVVIGALTIATRDLAVGRGAAVPEAARDAQVRAGRGAGEHQPCTARGSVMWINPSAVLLLLIPLVTIFLAYRAYLSEREKHEQLELLYQSSRILQHSPELDSALVALLDHARAMFRAEVAEVILYPREESADALRTTSVHDREPEAMVPEHVELGAGIHGRISAERRAFFTTTAGRPLSGRTVRQAMVSPLIGESGLIGSMTVANRLTEGTTFDGEDLRLLETLANQAAVALENGQLEQSLAELSRLKEQLRHQAYHDPLTGLGEPGDVRRAGRCAAGRPPARARYRRPVPRPRRLQDRQRHVGHGAGDRLLRVVAERINGCVRAEDLAARLGGDEFAVLLLDTPNLDRSLSVAQRIIEALQVPFQIGGQEIAVGASIGIAATSRADDTADVLLRNADVAMYTAKAAREAPRGGVRADHARCARRASFVVGGAVAQPRAR